VGFEDKLILLGSATNTLLNGRMVTLSLRRVRKGFHE
jgi:hypothetical protein